MMTHRFLAVNAINGRIGASPIARVSLGSSNPVRKQTGILLPNHLVAFTGAFFEPGAVFDGDMSTVISDESRFLQVASRFR
jgi:hypothetical protein